LGDAAALSSSRTTGKKLALLVPDAESEAAT